MKPRWGGPLSSSFLSFSSDVYNKDTSSPLSRVASDSSCRGKKPCFSLFKGLYNEVRYFGCLSVLFQFTTGLYIFGLLYSSLLFSVSAFFPQRFSRIRWQALVSFYETLSYFGCLMLFVRGKLVLG